VYDGRVVLLRGHQNRPNFCAGRASGRAQYKSLMSSQMEQYTAPCRAGGNVYNEAAPTAALRFRQPGLPSCLPTRSSGPCARGFDQKTIYTYTARTVSLYMAR